MTAERLRTTATPLRAVRLAQGKPQGATAKKASMSAAQLSRIEHGKQGLSIPTLYKLALALELKGLAKSLRPYVVTIEGSRD